MSRAVIEHSRIFPHRVGRGKRMFDRGCAILQSFLRLCLSVLARPSLSLFLHCTTTCTGKWIFTTHIPKAGESPREKPPRTKFTELPPPQLAIRMYKVTNLQYHCALCTSCSSWMRTCGIGDRAHFVPNSYIFRRNLYGRWIFPWILNLDLRFWKPFPKWMKQRLSL